MIQSVHAADGEYEITADIVTGVITGHFPRRNLNAVLEWYEIHDSDLLKNGHLAERREPLEPIQPLE